jgi:predicted RNase H-like nuclease
MRGARRAFASRANGRLGNRSRTAAGKARQAGAVRRHGLSLQVALDEALAPDVDRLAREIAASLTRSAKGTVNPADAAHHALACRVAEAMLDVRRVRLAKRPLVAALEADPADADALRKLERLDRYERRAVSRRKFATRDFAAAIAGVDPALPLRMEKFRIRRRLPDFGRMT